VTIIGFLIGHHAGDSVVASLFAMTPGSMEDRPRYDKKKDGHKARPDRLINLSFNPQDRLSAHPDCREVLLIFLLIPGCHSRERSRAEKIGAPNGHFVQQAGSSCPPY
jgi:hypothetical protein